MGLYFTGKLTAQPHPFIEAYKKLKKYEDDKHIAKLTIPAPAQLFQQLNLPKNFLGTRAIYPNINDLINDIAAVYQDFIRQFYAVGGRYLQLDDCSWGAILGSSNSISSQRYKELGSNLDDVKELAMRVNLSTSPTFDRQKRLEREGFIKGYHAILDAKKTD